MEEFKFVLKCLLVTVVLVVCLQIRVSNHTVESHMMSWVHHSSISHTLQDVAEGAVKVSKQGKDMVMNVIDNHAPETPAATEASQGSWFKIKRSAAYTRQKEREAQKVHEKAERAIDDLEESSSDDLN